MKCPVSQKSTLNASLSSSCEQLQFYHGVLAAIAQGIVARGYRSRTISIPSPTHHCPVLMLVRTYALYNCSRRVAIGLSTILVMGGVVSVVSFSISSLVWPCQRPAAYLLRTSGRSVRPCMTSTILPAGRRSITPAASWCSQKLSKESRVPQDHDRNLLIAFTMTM